MEIDQESGLPVIDSHGGYQAGKVYALYVNPANRHISGIIGFLGYVDQISDVRNYDTYTIEDLTEDEYVMISRSINSNESMTFLGEDGRTIISRRILIDLLDGTYYDQTRNMIYGLDNLVRMRVRCVDNTETESDDVVEVEVKNIKKMDAPISINGAPAENIKTTVGNPAEVSFQLQGEGVHTIRFKAKIPTVDYLWLTVYPQLLRLSSEDLVGLRQWYDQNKQ